MTKFKRVSPVGSRRSGINAAGDELQMFSAQADQFGGALTEAGRFYQNCEDSIKDYCNGKRKSLGIRAQELSSIDFSGTPAMTGGGSVPFVLTEPPLYSVFENIVSQLGTVEDITELLTKADIPGLEEGGFLYRLLEELNSVAGDFKDDVKDGILYKVFGYLNDCGKLGGAIVDGDTGEIEDLVDKYIKKCGKKLIGIKGITASVYLDLALNFGKSFGEGFDIIDESPGMGGVMSAAWNLAAGTMLGAGGSLASDVLELGYTICGKEFDKKDFEQCLDYMISHPWKSVEATGEVIKDTAVKAWKRAVSFVDSAAAWLEEKF